MDPVNLSVNSPEPALPLSSSASSEPPSELPQKQLWPDMTPEAGSHTSSALHQISIERDTITDEAHTQLDETVKNVIKYTQRQNGKPELSTLLSIISVMDNRLENLHEIAAKDLLQLNPAIKEALEQAWEAKSFKEVRRLGEFPVFPVENMCYN
jgi:hypothetical protein